MDESHTHNDWERVSLLGVEVDALSLNQLLTEIESCVLDGGKVIISYVNVHALNTAYTDTLFRTFLQASAIGFCDGAGVILGARILHKEIAERITYADFMWHLGSLAAERGLSMFFLGSAPGVAERAKETLVKKYPALRVIGTHHGYFLKGAEHRENLEVVAEINAARPDLLIVGMGMPIQEYWILENFDRLDVRVILNGGAVFDYVSGQLRRPPPWMTDNGLEWLGRLIVEPRRLWKRYLLGNPLFFWRLFVHHYLRVPLPDQER